MSKNKRVVFTFDERSLESLQKLTDQGRFSSMADTVRESLQISRALQSQAGQGFTEVRVIVNLFQHIGFFKRRINMLEMRRIRQEEKNQVVKQLKAKGKELNNQVAAKKKQMQKVSNAITAAIRRAVEEAKRETAAKAAADKKMKDAELKASKNAAENTTDNANTKTITKSPKKETTTPVAQGSVLLNSNADITLNENFIKNKGILPWPVDKGYPLLHYGSNKVGDIVIVSEGISIGCEIGTPVKIIFGGEVVLVNNYDDVQMVVVKHGSYFTGYSNLTGVNLNKGQKVQTGQVIGKVAANLDGIGAMDLIISNEKSEVNPEQWLRRR